MYTGEFWYITEVSDQPPQYCKSQKITRIPPLRYSDVDEIIYRKDRRMAVSFLDIGKFRPVKLGGEIKNERIYLRFMELLLKMDKLKILE